MTRYIIRRLLITIPVLFGVILLVFIVGRLLPGDPCRILLGERASDAICADFNHRFGLKTSKSALPSPQLHPADALPAPHIG